jgi:hypothetical protein
MDGVTPFAVIFPFPKPNEEILTYHRILQTKTDLNLNCHLTLHDLAKLHTISDPFEIEPFSFISCNRHLSSEILALGALFGTTLSWGRSAFRKVKLHALKGGVTGAHSCQEKPDGNRSLEALGCLSHRHPSGPILLCFNCLLSVLHPFCEPLDSPA